MANIGNLIAKLVKASKDNNASGITAAKKELNEAFAKQAKSAAAGTGPKMSSGVSSFNEMMGVQGEYIDIATGNLTKLREEYKLMYDMQREFIKEGGAYFEKFSEGDYKKAFSDMADESFKLFGSVEKIPTAFQTLKNNMTSFMMVSDSSRQSLAKTAAVAAELGMETSLLGNILDSATMAFGKNESEIESLASTITVMSQKFGMPAQELAQNFRKAQADMAYSSGKIMETFKRLQFTSRSTGVSFDSLTSAFGRSMDTFSGSASKAGTLNAILGRSVFNAVDLLGKTEAERVDTIVKGVRGSIGGDVNKLGKFQLLSISEGLGLSVEDTRKLLSGKTTIDQALKAKEPKDPRERALKAMAEAATDVNGSFDDLNKILRSTRTSFANLMIDGGAMMRGSTRDVIQQLGFESRAGIIDMMQDAVIGTGMKAGAVDMTVNQILTAVQKQDKQEITRLRTELRNKVDTRGGDQLNKNSPIMLFLKKLGGFEKSSTIDSKTLETKDGAQTMVGRALQKQLKDIGINVADQEKVVIEEAKKSNEYLATIAKQTASLGKATNPTGTPNNQVSGAKPRSVVTKFKENKKP